MQTFKTFFKIAKKQLPKCMIYFAVFAVLIILMSFATNDTNSRQYEAYSLHISVIDRDHSDASKALTDYLDSVHELLPIEDDGESIQDNLYYQKVSYVLTIPEGFEQNLLSDDSTSLVESSKRKDSASGFFVDEQINQYIKTLRVYLASGYSIEDATNATMDSLEKCEDVTSVSFEEKTDSSNTLMSYYFQFIPYVMIAILILGLCPILVIFQKKDLGNRINCSSLHHSSRTFQLSLGCVLFSLMIWAFFIILGCVMFGSAMFSKNGLLCILNSFVFLLICMAISLLVSTFAPNTNVLNMISNVVGLGMAFLCGVFVPQHFLGKQVLAVAHFLPAYWYIQINDRISGFSDDAFSMGFYQKALGIEFLFFVAIFAVYLVADKQRKQARRSTT